MFEFCRDDEEDISEFYLILSHHDRRPDAKADGLYRVRSRFDCPTGWTGWIRFVQTFTEQWTRVVPNVGTYTHDEYERETHRWTVVGSTPADGFSQPYDDLELHWNGMLERTAIDSNQPVSCISEVTWGLERLGGSDSGTDRLHVSAAGGGAYVFAPLPDPAGNQFHTSRAFDYLECNGTGGTIPYAGARNDPLGLIAGLASFGLQNPTRWTRNASPGAPRSSTTKPRSTAASR